MSLLTVGIIFVSGIVLGAVFLHYIHSSLRRSEDRVMRVMNAKFLSLQDKTGIEE